MEITETIKPKKAPYRALNPQERDMLFAFYEKWNGNMSEMILDKECLFKSYSQIRYYANLHHFQEQLVDKRRKRAEEVTNKLQDAKVLAIEQAMRILESHNVFVYTKFGTQCFDSDGVPLIVEKLPFYKEIKAAWEIIKTELGEATSIGKNDITSGGKPLENRIEVVFKKFGDEDSSK